MEQGRVFMLTGIQLEGEHEHRITSFYESMIEPTIEIAHEYLISEHAYGFDDTEDFDPEDFTTYGDGTTAIKLKGVREINWKEYVLLRKLGLA